MDLESRCIVNQMTVAIWLNYARVESGPCHRMTIWLNYGRVESRSIVSAGYGRYLVELCTGSSTSHADATVICTDYAP